ncbi:MAG: alpha/beta hydrolase [Planctomycetales bacterium]|nr:alpha/beta hydrolase [Planctomycetales bacterium]
MARPKDGKARSPQLSAFTEVDFAPGRGKVSTGYAFNWPSTDTSQLRLRIVLLQNTSFLRPVHDVKAAVRWMRANADKYSIDPDRIGTTGGSAGGHLAQFLGFTSGVKQSEGDGGNAEYSSSVDCVVNFFGPSDFTKSYDASVDAAEVLPLFLGGNLQERPRRHIVASPLYWVTPNAVPTLCVHGTEDSYVAYEQAVWLIDRLKASAVEAQLMTIDGADHGFRGATEEVKTQIEEARVAFFDKHLKRS